MPSIAALLAASLLLSAFSCERKNEDPCANQEIAGRSYQFYPCISNQQGAGAQLFVVNSADEFSSAFGCASFRPADAFFRDSTLLVGWKQYCCCGHVKSQRLTYSCEANTYTYQVAIEAGVCAAAMPVTSQLLVPKLPAGAKVVLDMQ